MRSTLLFLAITVARGAKWDVNGPETHPEGGLPLYPHLGGDKMDSGEDCKNACTANDECFEAVYSNGTCIMHGNSVLERGAIEGALYYVRDRGTVMIDCVGQALYDDMCHWADGGHTKCEDWRGDGSCDNGFSMSDSGFQIFLNCDKFDYDDGDCNGTQDPSEGSCQAEDEWIPAEEDDMCEALGEDVTVDCWGQVLTDEHCAVEHAGITKCEEWKGDGTCDGGMTVSDLGYMINFNCEEHNYDERDCKDSVPEAIDCEMDDWSEWNDCDLDCGGGSQLRIRTILEEPKFGGVQCEDLEGGGHESETQPCNEHACTPGPTVGLGDYIPGGKCKQVQLSSLSSWESFETAIAINGEYFEIDEAWNEYPQDVCEDGARMYQKELPSDHDGKPGKHAVLCQFKDVHGFNLVYDGQIYGKFNDACKSVDWNMSAQGTCDNIDISLPGGAMKVTPCGEEPVPVVTEENYPTPNPTIDCTTKAYYDQRVADVNNDYGHLVEYKKQCQAVGGTWETLQGSIGGICKPLLYKDTPDDNGVIKTKKNACKHIKDEGLCNCYLKCKSKYKEDGWNKCKGNLSFKKYLNGPGL